MTNKFTGIAPLTGIGILLKIQSEEIYNIEIKVGYEPGVIEDCCGWNFTANLNFDLFQS